MSGLPITRETYWRIHAFDPSGRAWSLYTFYALAAVRQDSSQPLATDKFCQLGLKWGSVNTVAKARLKLMKAEAVEHVHKFGYHYVKINFLTVKLKNKRVELSETTVPAGVMGSPGIFDYWEKWWERLTKGCLDEFSIRLKKEMKLKEKPDFDEMYNLLNVVYRRMNDEGYGIYEGKPDCELRFWYYLLRSVANEFKREERMKIKVA